MTSSHSTGLFRLWLTPEINDHPYLTLPARSTALAERFVTADNGDTAEQRLGFLLAISVPDGVSESTTRTVSTYMLAIPAGCGCELELVGEGAVSREPYVLTSHI